MPRILVIGGPGSGKTTLARRIQALTGMLVHELDATGYENGAGAKRSLDVKLSDVAAIASTDSWLAEGIFLGWTAALFDRATVIVWLDIPWLIAARRILTRHAKASLARTNKHRGLRNLQWFLQNALRYYRAPATATRALDDDGAVTRAETAKILAHYPDKVIRCRTNADVDRLLATLAKPKC